MYKSKFELANQQRKSQFAQVEQSDDWRKPNDKVNFANYHKFDKNIISIDIKINTTINCYLYRYLFVKLVFCE